MPASTATLQNLIAIITRLRQPDGCPWDIRQTPQSFKTYIIEEAHELLEAIDRDNPELVREELGDLLFQLIFVNNLYQEKGLFTLEEVIETISAKMIRRHPHVFGDLKVDSEESLRRQWHAIKAGEKNGQPDAPANQLRSIPKSLPALRRAHRVVERSARMGVNLDAAAALITELGGQLPELAQEHAANPAAAEKLLGDFLLCLSIMARQAGINLEEALQHSIDRTIEAVDQLPAAKKNTSTTASSALPSGLRDLLSRPKKH